MEVQNQSATSNYNLDNQNLTLDQNSQIKPKAKPKLPLKIVALVLLIITLAIIVLITFTVPIRKNGGTQSGFGQISPSITLEPTLEPIVNITDPQLKEINDNVDKIKKEIASPFNYKELLPFPEVDFNVSF